MTVVNIKEQVQKEKWKTCAALSHWGKLHWGQGVYSAFAVQQGESELPPAESDGFIVALFSPGQVTCAISHKSMPWMCVIHPQFNVSPPGECSSHHRQSCKQTNAEGGDVVSAKSRQGTGNGKTWGGSAQLTPCLVPKVGKVEVWGGYGPLPQPSWVFTLKQHDPDTLLHQKCNILWSYGQSEGSFFRKAFGPQGFQGTLDHMQSWTQILRFLTHMPGDRVLLWGREFSTTRS